MPDLTAKQQRFVAEYLVDGNGARAAIAAGYGVAGAKVRAHRLTKSNPSVQAEIRARQGEDSQRLQINRQDVLNGLQEAFAMAREKREPAAMVSAARELGRLLGLYASERHAVEVLPVGRVSRACWEAMSDAELAEWVAAGSAAESAH